MQLESNIRTVCHTCAMVSNFDVRILTEEDCKCSACSIPFILNGRTPESAIQEDTRNLMEEELMKYVMNLEMKFTEDASGQTA